MSVAVEAILCLNSTKATIAHILPVIEEIRNACTAFACLFFVFSDYTSYPITRLMETLGYMHKMTTYFSTQAQTVCLKISDSAPDHGQRIVQTPPYASSLVS
jgi:hypothetical protein